MSIKKLRKKLSNIHKNVDSIEKRLDILIEEEFLRELTSLELLEFTELKRLRSKLDPSYKFFG